MIFLNLITIKRQWPPGSTIQQLRATITAQIAPGFERR
jgi:hypothetical protein